MYRTCSSQHNDIKRIREERERERKWKNHTNYGNMKKIYLTIKPEFHNTNTCKLKISHILII